MNQDFLREAILLSMEKMEAGEGGPFGAVVVQNGKIVGRGWNRVTSTNDPTAHAEITVIRAASKKLGRFDLSGCELYASCEPCPMCFAAIHWAKIPRLYYGATRFDAASAGFQDDFLDEVLGLGGKPLRSPRVQVKQIDREACLPPFKEWLKKADRKQY